MTASSGQSPSFDPEARARFEAALRAGTPEPIERFVSPDHPAYLATVVELICVELEFAWQAAGVAETTDPENAHTPLPRVEDYLRRFPALHEPETLGRLIHHEYRVRHSHGDRPSFSSIRRGLRISRSCCPARAAGPPTASHPVAARSGAARGRLPRIPGYAMLESWSRWHGRRVQGVRPATRPHCRLKMLKPRATERSRRLEFCSPRRSSDLRLQDAPRRLPRKRGGGGSLLARGPGVASLKHPESSRSTADEHAGRPTSSWNSVPR
jgi:hypothetical protein